METRSKNVAIIGIVIAAIVISGLFVVAFYPQIQSYACTNNCQPTPSPINQTYTAYVVVSGHRQDTPTCQGFLCTGGLHAPITIDSIQVVYSHPPSDQCGCGNLLGFDKKMFLTVTESGPGTPYANFQTSFDVSLGGQWVQVFTYNNLQAGTYTFTANGVDQDGATSSATVTVTIP